MGGRIKEDVFDETIYSLEPLSCQFSTHGAMSDKFYWHLIN